MRRSHRLAPLALALALAASTSCSRAPEQEPAPVPAPRTEARSPVAAAADATPAPGSEAAPFDARFIDAMIPHHESGVAMAKEALAQAKRPEVRKLAQDIATSQAAEIETMRTWREAWYPGLPPTGAGSMMGMDGGHGGGAASTSGNGMAGMPGEGAGHSAAGSSVAAGASMPMGASHAAGSTDFDRDFLDQMIPHHAQAVDMAERATSQGEHQELRELAGRIVQQQEAEIALMKQWRREWGVQETAQGQDD